MSFYGLHVKYKWTCRHCGEVFFKNNCVGSWSNDHLKSKHPEEWAKLQTQGTYGDHFHHDPKSPIQ